VESDVQVRRKLGSADVVVALKSHVEARLRQRGMIVCICEYRRANQDSFGVLNII